MQIIFGFKEKDNKGRHSNDLSLPVIGWREVIGALKKRRFYPARQKGSHIIVENGQGLWTSIPRKDELGKGLLLSIIKDCGLTKQEFLKLL